MLLFAPTVAFATMQGDTCTAKELGTTKMAIDQANIIGCLKAGAVYKWKAYTQERPTVQIYTTGGNIGTHVYCALGEVQNGWRTSIGNRWTSVRKNSNGTWTVSATSDHGPYVVCFD